MNHPKIEVIPTLGPRGGLTRFTATINGEPLSLVMHSEQKFNTAREARSVALSYVRRHPERFA